MELYIPSISDVHRAAEVIYQHLSPAPLIRSYPLEKELGLPPSRRVWLKDYGFTPVRSFKLLGALNWMANNLERAGDAHIAAHSSGNFACGIAFACNRYNKRVVIVMPEDAPGIKFETVHSLGGETLTYDRSEDHLTGIRDKMTQQMVDEQGALRASPYDDPFVIAGNGVGGLEIVNTLKSENRGLSHLFCQVSGGGLMAGHCLPVEDGFPEAEIVGVEPTLAADFQQSLAAGERVRIERPESICDGLLAYDVGRHNWPILSRAVSRAVDVEDSATAQAMRWIYDQHGLRTEPSGAIATAALLANEVVLDGEGDIVVVISGRNVDEQTFRDIIHDTDA